jgi:hypothetical protein
MALDLLTSFSVIDEVDSNDGRDLYSFLLANDEVVEHSYRHSRDRVILTDRKIIALNIQGLTGKKKEYRVFPYTKIASFSVETAGVLDSDSDFKIWVSGVGVFEIKFAKRIDIRALGEYLSQKIK